MRDVLKNLNCFVDGRGYAGTIEEFTPPKLTLKTEDFQAGGMAGAVELTMGHEKLESDFTLIAVDRVILGTFNVREGFNTQFTCRGALESADGTVTPVVVAMRGKVKELDCGTWKPGEKAPTKVRFALSYLKITHGATVAQEIDVVNMVYVQNGVDLYAPIRAALGL